jgi:hypothetical protein
MAKKPAAKQTVNKSQAIRDYMKANPKASPKETSEALTQQGIKVTAAFVSTVKTQAKNKRQAKKKAAPAAKPAISDKVSISTLVQAKKMAEQLGGVDKAKATLEALAKLQ